MFFYQCTCTYIVRATNTNKCWLCHYSNFASTDRLFAAAGDSVGWTQSHHVSSSHSRRLEVTATHLTGTQWRPSISCPAVCNPDTQCHRLVAQQDHWCSRCHTWP